MKNSLVKSDNSGKTLTDFQSFENGSVDVKDIDGELWFCAKDVANAIEYKGNLNHWERWLDEEDRLKAQNGRTGQARNMTYISESALYRVLIKTDVPKAKPFERWVTKIVIPSIRKTGGYNVPKTYAEALQIAANQAKQIEEKNRQIAQMKPSADSWETYAGDMKQRSKEKSFRDVAKLLGLTPQKALIKWFFDNGYIMRGGDGWTATQRGIESGMLVNRIITAQNGHAGEQCKVTTFGMMKLSYLKGEGTFDNCIAQERTFGERRKPRNYRNKSTLTD